MFALDHLSSLVEKNSLHSTSGRPSLFNEVCRGPHIGDPAAGRFLGYTLRHAMTDMPAVLMPDFWPTEAALWCRLLEAQISYSKISNQFTRVAILTPYLTEEVVVQVSDVLIRPCVETSYDDLKNDFRHRRREAWRNCCPNSRQFHSHHHLFRCSLHSHLRLFQWEKK